MRPVQVGVRRGDKHKEMRKSGMHRVAQREFASRGTAIRLKDGKRPRFRIALEGGVYSCTWRGIILGFSATEKGMLADVNKSLVFMWKGYAKCSEKMTRGAMWIRRLMLEFFEEA